MKLEGKVCLVTGGGKGIGRGICSSFAKEGAKVAINYNESKKGAEDLADKLGKNAITIKANVSKKEEVDNMIDKVLDKFGKIDVLVNNAGISSYCSFLDLDEEEWDRTIDINLKGMYLCSRKAAMEMISRSIKGKIINISSVCGLLAQKGLVHYSASKGGINMLTKTMCLELAPYGINVNCIAPGAVEVDSTREELQKPIWKSVIPAGFWAQPEDIGKIAVFLASEDSKFIWGEIIYADGGQSIQLPMPYTLI
ncbi:MAG: glucose 1-dehydrogenase [Actinobacteria bacterium]|nr:glucose 1-dehydrogenase [Actinomycetota bacterium]